MSTIMSLFGCEKFSGSGCTLYCWSMIFCGKPVATFRDHALSGRGFHDLQLITSRSDSTPAQQLGDAFAIDPLAEVIALRVPATGRDEKFCLRVTYKCWERDESSFRWLWRDKSGNGGLK
jgi:hypothetical protein